MIERSVAFMPLGPRGASSGSRRYRYITRDRTGWYRYRPVFLPMDEPGKDGKKRPPRP